MPESDSSGPPNSETSKPTAARGPGGGTGKRRRRGPLDLLEWAGNKLPDPAMLFVLGALLVMVLSHIGWMMDWSVQPVRPQMIAAVEGAAAQPGGRPPIELVPHGEPLKVVSLLTPDGIFWAISSMVANFMAFPPLGVVLVGMLGIGVAERVGLFSALLRWLATLVPGKLLTPTMIFLGILSSAGMDAGYVVLPPLAAVLFIAAGRSPLVGIAAVFAGVSAGFCANIMVSGIDAMLAGATEEAARVIDPTYQVSIAANWYFIIGSAMALTLAGWGVTAKFVEPRLRSRPADEGGPQPITAGDVDSHRISASEAKGLRWSGLAILAFVAVVAWSILHPSGPLYTPRPETVAATEVAVVAITPAETTANGEPAAGETGATESEAAEAAATPETAPPPTERPPPARWVAVMVPLVFFGFLIPGIAYGISLGTVRSSKDVAKAMIDSMSAMAPIIVLAFFAAQFVQYFRHSNLGEMLAMTGGQALFAANLPPSLLLIAFIGLIMVLNLFVGSMSAKYFLAAPIFIPMFMMLGISPELTQAAYRIGDSVTNIVTPLNSYLVILLIVMQKYAPRAGIGTMIAMMMPYTIFFSIVWAILLLLWIWIGIPLGPGETGPLWYAPPAN